MKFAVEMSLQVLLVEKCCSFLCVCFGVMRRLRVSPTIHGVKGHSEHITVPKA